MRESMKAAVPSLHRGWALGATSPVRHGLRAVVVLSLATAGCSIGALPPWVGADATGDGAQIPDARPSPMTDGPAVGGAGGNDVGPGNGGVAGGDIAERSDGPDVAPANGGAGSGGIVNAGGGAAGQGGGTGSSGGVVGAGGTLASGGSAGNGGILGSGGTGNSRTTGTGGVRPTGGVVSAGGTPGSGGIQGSGGHIGSGGISVGNGGSGSGGVPGTGGAVTDGGTETVDCSATMPSGGSTHTGASVNGTADGLNYGIWTSGDGGSITVFPNAHAFAASWNNSEDFLVYLGLDFAGTKSYTAYGTIAAQFVETKAGTGGDFSSIGVYGWMHSPCIEWYINEDSFNGLAPTSSITATIDGATYYLATSTERGTSGSNACEAGHTGDWTRITSTRATAHQCGTVTVSDHFAAWAAQGWTLGSLASVHVNVEVAGGVGDIQFPVANVTTTSK